MCKIDKQLVEQWKNMTRDTDDARREATIFYDQNIFPNVNKVFARKYKPEKDYDGLILTVGFSPSATDSLYQCYKSKTYRFALYT